jgi:hypothetical protein
VDKAVDGCQRHSLIREHLAPCAEWLVCGDQHRAPLVAGSDQLEQHARFGLILADIGNVVEDQQLILVKLGERVFERELAACDLQALDEIAGAHEQHAPSILDESESDGCGKMALAGAGRARDIVRRNIRLKLSSIIRIIPALENASSLSDDSFTGVAFTL